MNKVICIPLQICGVLLVLFIAMLMVVLGWLSIAPREFGFAQPQLQEFANQSFANSEVSLGIPKLFLNLKEFRFEGRVDDIAIHNKNGRFSIQSMRVAIPVVELILFHPYATGVHLGDLHLELEDGSQALHIPSIHLSPDSEIGGVTNINVDLSDISDSSTLSAVIEQRDDDVLHVTIQYEDIPLSFASLFATDLEQLRGTLTGQTVIDASRIEGVNKVTGEVLVKGLSFTHSQLYPKPLKLDKMAGSYDWAVREDRVTVPDFQIVRGDMLLKASGNTDIAFQQASLDVTLQKLRVDDLKYLWPHQLASEPREWVTNRISHGSVTDGKARVTVNGDVIDVDAMINLDDITVTYADHLPPAKNAKGNVTFTEDSMFAAVERATSLSNSVATDATLEIASFTQGAIPMVINLPIQTSASDVATYISPKYLNKAHALQLNPEEITGKAQGTVMIGFPLYPEKYGDKHANSLEYLDIDIEAVLNDISQPAVMNRWDVENLNGVFHLDSKQLSMDAAGQLNDVPAKLNIMYGYAAQQPVATYKVALETHSDKFEDFNVMVPAGYIDGNVKIDATIKETAHKKEVLATMDVSDAHINIDYIDWVKPKSKPTTLSVKQVVTDSKNTLESLNVTSDDVNIQGMVVLSNQGELVKVHLSTLQTPDMDINLLYEPGATRDTITVSGSKFEYARKADKESAGSTSDVKVSVGEAESEGDVIPTTHLENKKISISLDKVNINGQLLRNVKFHSDCGAYCDILSASLAYGESDVASLTLIKKDGKRMIDVNGSNVATLLKALEVSQDIRGGALSFKGEFDDTIPSRPLSGRMIIGDITLRDAPILTSMITLASLRGIADTLSGNGIVFDSIKSNLRFEGDVITLDGLVAKGDAMGVLLDGTLQPFIKRRMNLEGTVIPSYTLNSLPGKVPIIGELLVGGEDEGIFGTRFSIRGATSNPDITVNPLSMLTPGFLRNIFDVFPDADSEED